MYDYIHEGYNTFIESLKKRRLNNNRSKMSLKVFIFIKGPD